MYHKSTKEILIEVSIAVIIPLVSIVTPLVEWRDVIHHPFSIFPPLWQGLLLEQTVTVCAAPHVLWSLDDFLSCVYFLVRYWIINLTPCVRDLTDLCKLCSGLDGLCCLPISAFPFSSEAVRSLVLKYLSQDCPSLFCCQLWLAPCQTLVGTVHLVSVTSLSLVCCSCFLTSDNKYFFLGFFIFAVCSIQFLWQIFMFGFYSLS